MKEYNTSQDWDTMLSALQKDFPNYHIEVGNGLLIQDNLINLLNSGKKKTAIRYSKGAIRIPCEQHINLIETKQDDKAYRRYKRTVTVEKITVKEFGKLTHDDAVNEGFRDKRTLAKFLTQAYGNILINELVVIYHIK